MMHRVFIFLLLISSFTYAHGLKIFVSETNSTLHVKAYFSKSSPCEGCNVSVYAMDDVLLMEQKTNEQGELSLPLLAQKLRIRVNASMGHQHEILFSTDTPIEEEYPAWVKIVLGLVIIATFFGGLKFARRGL